MVLILILFVRTPLAIRGREFLLRNSRMRNVRAQ